MKSYQRIGLKNKHSHVGWPTWDFYFGSENANVTRVKESNEFPSHRSK